MSEKNSEIPKTWNDFPKIRPKCIGYNIAFSDDDTLWTFGIITSIFYKLHNDVVYKQIEVAKNISYKLFDKEIIEDKSSELIIITGKCKNILYLGSYWDYEEDEKEYVDIKSKATGHRLNGPYHGYYSPKQMRYMYYAHPEIAKEHERQWNRKHKE